MPSKFFLTQKEIHCYDTGEDCIGYKEYLTSKHWERLRAKLIKPDTVCSACGKRSILQLHHLTYQRLGGEQDDDFAILCPECHKKAHEAKRACSSKSPASCAKKKKANYKKNSKKNSCKKKKVKNCSKSSHKYKNKSFSKSCEHCFDAGNYTGCDLGYEWCPLLKCGDYRKRESKIKIIEYNIKEKGEE